jgi:hypothetical protein
MGTGWLRVDSSIPQVAFIREFSQELQGNRGCPEDVRQYDETLGRIDALVCHLGNLAMRGLASNGYEP